MKILMLTSSLETGGVETHIATLSRALRGLGHTVVLASAGGAMAERLMKEGFSHHTIPLDSRKPSELLLCNRLLFRLIRTGGFDVVHAHARIPAYLVGRIRRRHPRMCFRFCVTCHSAFRVTPFYRRVTEWGDGMIAVSEDLRSYLAEQYDMNPDRISVIPNGIDCVHFSPLVSYMPHGTTLAQRETVSGLDSEVSIELAPDLETLDGTKDREGNATKAVCVDGSFSLVDSEKQLATERSMKQQTTHRVLFLSRLDADCSLVAELLIRLTPRLRERFQDLSVTIVGGGSEYQSLYPLAAQNGVQMPGEVDDSLDLLRDCDVFLGVSRAAMEASAVGKPVILAGNEGYLGVLNRQTRDLAESTNYTCRGYSFGEKRELEELLLADLISLLSAPSEVRRALGEENRAQIEAYHSIRQTVERTVCFYDTLPQHLPGKCVLIGGYFGFRNTGDDAVAEVLIEQLRRRCPHTRVMLLTQDPERDRAFYGTECVKRTSLIQILGALGQARVYLMGGGSLLQNLTSERSLSYYLSIVRMAYQHRVPVVLFCGGIGPIHGSRAEARIRQALSRTETVSARDRQSLHRMGELGVPPERLFFGADPAILLSPCDPSRTERILRLAHMTPDGRYLAIALGKGGRSEQTKLIQLVSLICRRNRLTPLYFELFPTQDTEAANVVCQAVGFGGMIMPRLTPRELLSILPYCTAALSLRLHLLIFAVSAGIPAVGIGGSDPKIVSFCEEAELPVFAPLAAASPEKIAQLFGKLLERRTEICHNILMARAELRERAATELDRVLSWISNG